jgi:hypothetical protein
MQRAGVTPGKMVLVAVLAVVLVTVIVLQLGGSTAEPVKPRASAKKTKAGAKQRAADTKARTVTAKNADRKPAVRQTPWPRVPLDETIRHDPLAVPRWLAPPTPTVADSADSPEPSQETQSQRHMAWERLRGQGVAVVLITRDGPVATVGDRQVRVGDLIDGFRVEKIDGQGLLLVDPN